MRSTAVAYTLKQQNLRNMPRSRHHIYSRQSHSVCERTRTIVANLIKFLCEHFHWTGCNKQNFVLIVLVHKIFFFVWCANINWNRYILISIRKNIWISILAAVCEKFIFIISPLQILILFFFHFSKNSIDKVTRPDLENA